MADPFEVLGVRAGASKEEIRAAYREQVARFHPDKHHGNPLEELAAAKLVEINRAYEILSADDRRVESEGGPARRASRSEGERARSPAPAAPHPAAKLARSLGMIASLLLFLKFGLGLVGELFLLGRALVMGLLSLLRIGPVVAVAVALAVGLSVSHVLRSRKGQRGR
ncbi:MAG TPA: J domain-containing protein [Polyangiaceae bacterium]|nr:J domain-containing protein [Polyangiaceae bacterium]